MPTESISLLPKLKAHLQANQIPTTDANLLAAAQIAAIDRHASALEALVDAIDDGVAIGIDARSSALRVTTDEV